MEKFDMITIEKGSKLSKVETKS